jgi:hypothetical protein
VKASINTQLVRIELVISEDREHGTGMDHIASAPVTHPMTRVGYSAMTIITDRTNTTVIVIMNVMMI